MQGACDLARQPQQLEEPGEVESEGLHCTGRLARQTLQPDKPGHSESDELLKSVQFTLQSQPPVQSAIFAPERMFLPSIPAAQLRAASRIATVCLRWCPQLQYSLKTLGCFTGLRQMG